VLQKDDTSLLHYGNDGLIKSFEWIAEASPGGTVEHFDEMTLVKTGILSSSFNMVFALSRPNSNQNISGAVRSAFIHSRIPWELITTSETSESVQPLIQEFGLVRVNVEPGMILEPLPKVIPQPPKELDIRQVNSFDEMQTLLHVGIKAFGDSTGTLLSPLARALAEGSGSFRGGCYLGYVASEPVATSIRFSFGRSAGIYFVGTLQEFRKRGFGEAMTWRASIDGGKDGCEFGFLQASEMGFPIYEKMGYRRIVDYEIWKPKELSFD
jgi:hypothetical protein